LWIDPDLQARVIRLPTGFESVAHVAAVARIATNG